MTEQSGKMALKEVFEQEKLAVIAPSAGIVAPEKIISDVTNLATVERLIGVPIDSQQEWEELCRGVDSDWPQMYLDIVKKSCPEKKVTINEAIETYREAFFSVYNCVNTTRRLGVRWGVLIGLVPSRWESMASNRLSFPSPLLSCLGDRSIPYGIASRQFSTTVVEWYSNQTTGKPLITTKTYVPEDVVQSPQERIKAVCYDMVGNIRDFGACVNNLVLIDDTADLQSRIIDIDEWKSELGLESITCVGVIEKLDAKDLRRATDYQVRNYLELYNQISGEQIC